MAGEEAGQHVV